MSGWAPESTRRQDRHSSSCTPPVGTQQHRRKPPGHHGLAHTCRPYEEVGVGGCRSLSDQQLQNALVTDDVPEQLHLRRLGHRCTTASSNTRRAVSSTDPSASTSFTRSGSAAARDRYASATRFWNCESGRADTVGIHLAGQGDSGSSSRTATRSGTTPSRTDLVRGRELPRRRAHGRRPDRRVTSSTCGRR